MIINLIFYRKIIKKIKKNTKFFKERLLLKMEFNQDRLLVHLIVVMDLKKTQ